MKCKSCGSVVPPNFIAAISDNKCPACGSKLMSELAYKNIFKVKKQIKDLGFDDKILLGVAAALASNFTLVPKSFSLEEDPEAEPSVELEDLEDDDDDTDHRPGPTKPMTARRIPNVKGMSPKTAQRIKQASTSMVEEAEYMADVSPEEEAALVKDWGLDVSPADNVPVGRPKPGDNEFVDMFANIGIGGESEGPVDADHEVLLAKAQALREDPTKFKIKRVDS